MRHCNKKFALKWHKVQIRYNIEWPFPTEYFKKAIKQLPSNGRFRVLYNDPCFYVENEDDAVMIALMYS